MSLRATDHGVIAQECTNEGRTLLLIEIMAKYIDADLLRKEIEFAKSVYDNPNRVVHGVADAFRQDGRAAMCDDILKKIDSLQQEQPEEPDKSLEEAADEYSNKNEYMDVGFCVEPVYIGHKTEAAFIAGAKWQKGQMLKEAVEIGTTDIYWEQDGDRAFPTFDPPVEDLLMPGVISQRFNEGDKVRIIIVKED